jgi:WhiB family redox-sensing transcriptional regulator
MTTTTRRARTNAAPTSRDWKDLGPCRNEDPELFFPIGSSPQALAQEEEAKRVCWRCPVMQRCGQWAVETRQDAGVWGGMSERDRRLLHRRDGRRTFRPGQMSASDHIITYQLREFLALQAKGFKPIDIARGLSTNVQTVNNVLRKLAERASAEVKAA